MPTAVTWNGTAYSVPATGELNWGALSSFLVDLGNNAQTTNFQKLRQRKVTSSPVTVLAATDCVILVNVAGAATVDLPAGSADQVFYVLDISGAAATNNITIDGNGAETIAGVTTYVINGNNNGVGLIWNDTDSDWEIFTEVNQGFFGSNQIFNQKIIAGHTASVGNGTIQVKPLTEVGLELLSLNGTANKRIMQLLDDGSGNGTLAVMANNEGTNHQLKGGGDALFCANAGNVGVNLSMPDKQFVVEDTGGVSGTVIGQFQMSGGNSLEGRIRIAGTSATGSLSANSEIGSLVGSSATRSQMIFYTRNSSQVERMRLDEDGLLDMSQGTSTGIRLPSGSSDLDYYDEGTWTPTAFDAQSGGNEANGYTIQEGTYTRVGRKVFVYCLLSDIDTTGMTGANTLFIRGLPFVSKIRAGGFEAVLSAVLSQDLTFTGGAPVAVVQEELSSVLIKTSVSGGTQTTAVVSDIANSTNFIQFSGVYEV